MTTKQIEKLHKECGKFGMDFDDQTFWKYDELKNVVRWSKGYEKPSRGDVRRNLEKIGCQSVEHLQEMNKINLDWV